MTIEDEKKEKPREQSPQEARVCQICKAQKNANDMLSGALVEHPVAETIKQEHPAWSGSKPICRGCLNHFRAERIQSVLEKQKGQLSKSDARVVKSLRKKEVLSKNINAEFEERLTLGEKAADKVADFGGSWPFIILFAAFFLSWIALNSVQLLWKPFDPYPFILLNLILSCLAAIQAPIIMMSQNRQESKDRLRAEHDYEVNLKAELEIRHINERIELLLTQKWPDLLEAQKAQTEIIEKLVSQSETSK